MSLKGLHFPLFLLLHLYSLQPFFTLFSHPFPLFLKATVLICIPQKPTRGIENLPLPLFAKEGDTPLNPLLIEGKRLGLVEAIVLYYQSSTAWGLNNLVNYAVLIPYSFRSCPLLFDPHFKGSAVTFMLLRV